MLNKNNGVLCNISLDHLGHQRMKFASIVHSQQGIGQRIEKYRVLSHNIGLHRLPITMLTVSDDTTNLDLRSCKILVRYL